MSRVERDAAAARAGLRMTVIAAGLALGLFVLYAVSPFGRFDGVNRGWTFGYFGPHNRVLERLEAMDGVTFLDVPRVVVSAVRAGPLRRNARRVEDMIEDSERTLLLPVALAEELPTRETAELVERLRAGVGIAVDRVVVNGVFPAPFPAGLEDLHTRLRRLPADTPLGRLPRPSVLADCAGYLNDRHRLNRGYVDEIGRVTGLPVTCLPYLREGVEGPEQIAILAEPLTAAPRGVP